MRVSGVAKAGDGGRLVAVSAAKRFDDNRVDHAEILRDDDAKRLGGFPA